MTSLSKENVKKSLKKGSDYRTCDKPTHATAGGLIFDVFKIKIMIFFLMCNGFDANNYWPMIRNPPEQVLLKFSYSIL